MNCILDEYTEPALPLLALLADFDRSSVAASAETRQTEHLYFCSFLSLLAVFLS